MRFDRCTNCSTERLPIKARHLCRRCYAVTRKLEQLQKWKPGTPPKWYPQSLHLSDDEVVRMRADVVKQLKDCLKKIASQEARLREPIDSMMVESKLAWLAQKAGVRNRSIVHGTASCFDSFTPEQRAILFDLLNLIDVDIPRRNCIHWTRYLTQD
jgi:hypothetical protein